MPTITLSPPALILLRRRLEGEWVGVTEANRPLYRELMAEGLVYPVSTFLHGREGYYRPTDAAVALRDRERISDSRTPLSSPEEVPRRVADGQFGFRARDQRELVVAIAFLFRLPMGDDGPHPVPQSCLPPELIVG